MGIEGEARASRTARSLSDRLKSVSRHLLGEVAFGVAQLYRFVPFNSARIADRFLQFWFRWRPIARRRPFRGGLGYVLAATTDNLGYIAGTHEAAYLRVIHRRLLPGSCLVDIGANAGTSVLWLYFARPRKELTFVAVEAMPDTFAILSENILLNPQVQCRVFNGALSDRAGALEFGSAGPGDGSARVQTEITATGWSGRTRVKVQALTLDALVEKLACRPSFLLIDVEGFGGEVLSGAAATIAKHRPEIGLELHSEREAQLAEELLGKWQYRPVWESRRYGHHKIYGSAPERTKIFSDEN